MHPEISTYYIATGCHKMANGAAADQDGDDDLDTFRSNWGDLATDKGNRQSGKRPLLSSGHRQRLINK